MALQCPLAKADAMDQSQNAAEKAVVIPPVGIPHRLPDNFEYRPGLQLGNVVRGYFLTCMGAGEDSRRPL